MSKNYDNQGKNKFKQDQSEIRDDEYRYDNKK
jgi:hypothetical protein